ncbi:MAG: 2-oxo acid dehydrogenase subunit E2 [Bdellovibrionales bacterium]|nr:2-oxo acid dehydrogenase subunit E2 [Bdellovibrionales bacterium]
MSELIDIVMPESSDEGTESVVGTWLIKPGETVKIHDPVLEISTDKVTVEVAAPASGILAEILKEEGAEVQPGDILGRMEQLGEEEAAASASTNGASTTTSKTTSAKSSSSEDLSAELTPAVRRLVKQHGIDVSKISGTGKGGRITADDIEAFLAGGAPSSGASTRIPHTPMRKSIADHMVRSMLKTAPHVTAVFDCDMSAVIAHRNANKDAFAAEGIKLTFTSYFVRAAVEAIKAVPQTNSRWHDDALELIEDCNIGIATAIEKGLIVPVLASAQMLDLKQTAEKLQGIVERARDDKLDPSEVKGGTFTITNHGVSGSLIATPIINQPQSAILGIGKLEKRVVVDENDQIVIRPMVYVTLTIDHRGLDGFQANSFLSKFVDTLQSWN